MSHGGPGDVLKTWHSLDAVIMETDEEAARALLKHEQRHGRRLRFMLRLYNRVSRLRREREIAALVEITTEGMRKRGKSKKVT